MGSDDFIHHENAKFFERNMLAGTLLEQSVSEVIDGFTVVYTNPKDVDLVKLEKQIETIGRTEKSKEVIIKYEDDLFEQAAAENLKVLQSYIKSLKPDIERKYENFKAYQKTGVINKDLVALQLYAKNLMNTKSDKEVFNRPHDKYNRLAILHAPPKQLVNDYVDPLLPTRKDTFGLLAMDRRGTYVGFSNRKC